MIFTTNQPLVEGDTINLYYGGFNATHAASTAQAAIGLATLRKDGFVSLDAGAQAGSITTTPLRTSGGPLAVNYIARDGLLQVEILDDNGADLDGYGREDCLPLPGDSVGQPVLWKSRNTLPATPDNIRLWFILRNASLYSFGKRNRAN